MKLESQVASLDLSKRLRELGVKQKSLFFWDLDGRVRGYWPRGGGLLEVTNIELEDPEIVSAFTVAELGVVLPVTLGSGRPQIDVELYKYQDSFGIQLMGYFDNNTMYTIWTVRETTEANARAAMLIHLLENKIITVEEVNARLEAA